MRTTRPSRGMNSPPSVVPVRVHNALWCACFSFWVSSTLLRAIGKQFPENYLTKNNECENRVFSFVRSRDHTGRVPAMFNERQMPSYLPTWHTSRRVVMIFIFNNLIFFFFPLVRAISPGDFSGITSMTKRLGHNPEIRRGRPLRFRETDRLSLRWLQNPVEKSLWSNQGLARNGMPLTRWKVVFWRGNDGKIDVKYKNDTDVFNAIVIDSHASGCSDIFSMIFPPETPWFIADVLGRRIINIVFFSQIKKNCVRGSIVTHVPVVRRECLIGNIH